MYAARTAACGTRYERLMNYATLDFRFRTRGFAMRNDFGVRIQLCCTRREHTNSDRSTRAYCAVHPRVIIHRRP